MKSLFLLTLLSISIVSVSFAGNYRLNDSKIEAAFEHSIDISNDQTVASFFNSSASEASVMMSEGGMDKQTLAAIVAFAEWFLGVGILIPIHRLVLGCGGSEIKVVALYCITLGGCGLLPLIDGIMLIIDAGGTRYIDNPKYLMWIN